MQSYLTGTTCVLAGQNISATEDRQYLLSIDYECLFTGGSAFAASYVIFVSDHESLVTEDLASLGVIECFAPSLPEVDED